MKEGTMARKITILSIIFCSTFTVKYLSAQAVDMRWFYDKYGKGNLSNYKTLLAERPPSEHQYQQTVKDLLNYGEHVKSGGLSEIRDGYEQDARAIAYTMHHLLHSIKHNPYSDVHINLKEIVYTIEFISAFLSHIIDFREDFFYLESDYAEGLEKDFYRDIRSLFPQDIISVKEEVINIVKINPDLLGNFFSNFNDDEDVVLAAVENGYYAFRYASDRLKDKKNIVLTAVSTGGVGNKSLKYASNRLQDDKEIVITAVRENCFALEFASDRLKDDKEVVLASITEGGSGIKYASERLRDDKQIAMLVVRGASSDLYYLSDRLKNDKEVVLETVKEWGTSLEHASKRLRNNKKFVISAIEIDIRAYSQASDRLKSNRKVALAVLDNAKRSENWILGKMPSKLFDDEDFVNAAAKKFGRIAFEYASPRLKKKQK